MHNAHQGLIAMKMCTFELAMNATSADPPTWVVWRGCKETMSVPSLTLQALSPHSSAIRQLSQTINCRHPYLLHNPGTVQGRRTVLRLCSVLFSKKHIMQLNSQVILMSSVPALHDRTSGQSLGSGWWLHLALVSAPCFPYTLHPAYLRSSID